MLKVVLSLAGSDPSGGAGIQGDLKTFHAHGTFGQAVIALLTVQNTLGVQEVWPLSTVQVLRQVEVLLQDFPPSAIKFGAVGAGETLRQLARLVAGLDIPWVVDPVLHSTSGASYGDDDTLRALREEVGPNATLITPNLAEAAAPTGRPVRSLDEARAAA